MKLLIVTQTVDTDDPILGFFVRWIEEFAKHAERVEVICLKEGKHELPMNVRVHSLGKERGGSRVSYILNFYRFLWRFRREYDAVFVHMNPEYVLLGGPFWRLLGKRVALWYTHKNVDTKLRLASWLANVIFTASKESFRIRTSKVRVMGHGIDTEFFSPDGRIARGTAVLSAGRLSPTKRHDLIIRAAEYFPNDVRIVGDGPEHHHLKELAMSLSLASRVHFLGAYTQAELQEEYRKAWVFVHMSETGSLDKVVLEALACGLPVITTSTILSDLPVTVTVPTPTAIAEAVLATPRAGAAALAAYVRHHHSLYHLIPAILEAL